ncbi:MAG: NADH-quinone oxidoreductase subunit H [Chitinispirillaceae bacterium]|nr:NADH-quinone oxidoreductase subunit H [Chitinispirillaceae bacterium]
MEYGLLILQVIVFPGLLFTAVVGLITTWIDRKVTARVQMRAGPPFLQPFYDIVKYMIKETCVPAEGSRMLFLAAPLIGMVGVVAASTIIWRSIMWPQQAFVGDLIVVLYLLTMPALAVVLGSFSSRNPLASLGGSREMKLIMSYELPFILAIMVPVIKAASINFGGILAASMALASPSGVIAFIVAIICMQAKLTLVPFDMPEAETELTGGAYIEYSGPPLGIFKLTRAMMLFTVPMFLIALFWGGIGFGSGVVSIILGILKYVLLVVITVLVRNTAPRVRIDQAVKFFWGPMTLAGILAVGLALAGY